MLWNGNDKFEFKIWLDVAGDNPVVKGTPANEITVVTNDSLR
jgi:hypothetical protein